VDGEVPRTSVERTSTEVSAEHGASHIERGKWWWLAACQWSRGMAGEVIVNVVHGHPRKSPPKKRPQIHAKIGMTTSRVHCSRGYLWSPSGGGKLAWPWLFFSGTSFVATWPGVVGDDSRTRYSGRCRRSYGWAAFGAGVTGGRRSVPICQVAPGMRPCAPTSVTTCLIVGRSGGRRR